MEHRYSMSEKDVERALESAYDASADTDFDETGALLLIGSTYENAQSFQRDNEEVTGSHDIDIVAIPHENYDLNRFLNEFNDFWKNYAEESRNKNMHLSTYSDSNHETQANWITSQVEDEEGKIPGHALLFPSVQDIEQQAPEGFYQAVKNEHIPLHGSLEQANNNPTPVPLDEFISEYHGPSGPLITDSFPEQVEWRTLEQILNYTDEHYKEFIDDQSQFTNAKHEVQRAAKRGLETAQVTPQELHRQITASLTSKTAP